MFDSDGNLPANFDINLIPSNVFLSPDTLSVDFTILSSGATEITPSTTSDSFSSEGYIMMTPGSSIPGCESTESCFLPYVYHVPLGTNVIWVNDDDAVHSATSGVLSGHPSELGELFDSGLMLPGSEYSAVIICCLIWLLRPILVLKKFWYFFHMVG